MANPDERPAISEQTLAMLDKQVRKGKARKFFLVYKGATIKSLGVFKKGPFGVQVMQAKKAGFVGDVACGLVSGSGSKLLFLLPGNGEIATAMKTDGWWVDAPPVKKVKLREFLKVNGLKFKPDCEIVKDLSRVPKI